MDPRKLISDTVQGIRENVLQMQTILILAGCHCCGRILTKNGEECREDARIIYQGSDEVGKPVCGSCYSKVTGDNYSHRT